MATGRSIQLTKQIGEYLVSAELCRRELISTTFTGNVPIFDILATNKDLQTTSIQVKTISKGSWQFDAKKFLEISIINDIQTVNGKTKLDNPDLKYVFVRLKGQNRNQDEFYICRVKDIQDIIYRKYSKSLAEKEGRRPNNPNSTHCAVHPKDLEDYKNKWEIIK